MNLHVASKETWVHKVNPSIKLMTMLLLFIVILLVHQLNILVYLSVIVFAAFWCFSGYVAKVKSLLLVPFILVFVSSSSSMILFGKGDIIWIKWGLIQVTEESFYRGLHIGFRALLFGLSGLLFTLTTRPVMLFYSLMQQLKLKPTYAYSFMAGFRLLPIMAEEFITIRNAMVVRGLNKGKGILGKMITFRSFALPLLAQSIRKAHRIAVAMEAKRFSGSRDRTFFYTITYSRYDALFILMIIMMLIISYIASSTYPVFPVGDVRYGV
ncbi:energy-coupling factor transporter transmembrane protein EcfT [Rossellomorea aquimaris]|uniref:energy-coupling factor transporter transmembrane component T family protein n=1 Tax=Rossellomorea aquimaris TaxID=189382 RepID=UPI001CD79CF1|nr:energy-coupling factor transporter transmembrane component T [Rossellomorea aquimaris]MCA1053874.1 energy-coupling factor transporter transmembrane protein EcfT [Rossellomorea aquimaris]